jgi:hypothetical protein
MAKVVLEKRLVEVPIAMGPSHLEVLSGLHVGYFWQVHLAIALAYGTLHWRRRGCFVSSGFSANAAALVLGWSRARILFRSL